jgi:hypothetical protein
MNTIVIDNYPWFRADGPQTPIKCHLSDLLPYKIETKKEKDLFPTLKEYFLILTGTKNTIQE